MNSFTPARALRALIVDANDENVIAALYAVIDELPDEISSTDDLSSRKIVDLIFTALAEGAE